MIAAILAAFGLPSWTPYAIGAALFAALGLYVYHLGYASADAKWKAKEQDRIIYAQAESIRRYSEALEASNRQREEEAAASADRESVLTARAAELEAEAKANAAANDNLEADLRAAVTDKGKADALISKLRATARTDCRATARDIDVDQRMRRNKKPGGR